jgi:hypothetical protein
MAKAEGRRQKADDRAGLDRKTSPVSAYEGMGTCVSAPASTGINELLTRFFLALDDRNWRMMRDCLSDLVFADYSSAGAAASTVWADRYVEDRRTALGGRALQHSFANLRVELDAAGETAMARCNYVVRRLHSAPDETGHSQVQSCGVYFFAFADVRGMWKITSITQHRMRNRGNRGIHRAGGESRSTRLQSPHSVPA